jgi:hypothetical protein
MAEKLKACPFCGKPGERVDGAIERWSGDVFCSNDDCEATEIALSIDVWNSRPREEALERLLRENKGAFTAIVVCNRCDTCAEMSRARISAIDAALKEEDHGTS